MRITEEMVKDWVTDGIASCVQAINGDAKKIAAQISAELSTNKSGTSRNTIGMSITLKLDADQRKAEITGGYTFKTPNLGDESPKIIREIPDPDQGELAFDATTPNPEDSAESGE